MITVKTTAWVSLDTILELLQEGEVKTLRGNDSEELTLYVNYRDRTRAKEVAEASLICYGDNNEKASH